MQDPFYQLMFITNKNDTPLNDYLKLIDICAANGITCVQLREKNLSYHECLNFGKKLKEILQIYKIPLIINDHLDLALELDAEGVHLGQSDGDLQKARQLLGPEKILGLSINHQEELIIANQLELNYVGIGAIFPSRNKQNISRIWNIDGLKQLSLFSKHPIVAVGGIHERNVESVISSGAQGIAAIDAFHHTDRPRFITQKLRRIIQRKSHHA